MRFKWLNEVAILGQGLKENLRNRILKFRQYFNLADKLKISAKTLYGFPM